MLLGFNRRNNEEWKEGLSNFHFHLMHNGEQAITTRLCVRSKLLSSRVAPLNDTEHHAVFVPVSLGL